MIKNISQTQPIRFGGYQAPSVSDIMANEETFNKYKKENKTPLEEGFVTGDENFIRMISRHLNNIYHILNGKKENNGKEVEKKLNLIA